jgi:hypothetical protein
MIDQIRDVFFMMNPWDHENIFVESITPDD